MSRKQSKKGGYENFNNDDVDIFVNPSDDVVNVADEEPTTADESKKSSEEPTKVSDGPIMEKVEMTDDEIEKRRMLMLVILMISYDAEYPRKFYRKLAESNVMKVRDKTFHAHEYLHTLDNVVCV